MICKVLGDTCRLPLNHFAFFAEVRATNRTGLYFGRVSDKKIKKLGGVVEFFRRVPCKARVKLQAPTKKSELRVTILAPRSPTANKPAYNIGLRLQLSNDNDSWNETFIALLLISRATRSESWGKFWDGGDARGNSKTTHYYNLIPKKMNRWTRASRYKVGGLQGRVAAGDRTCLFGTGMGEPGVRAYCESSSFS